MSNATEPVRINFPIPGPGLFKVTASNLDKIIEWYAFTPLSELARLIDDSGVLGGPVKLGSRFEALMIMAEIHGYGL